MEEKKNVSKVNSIPHWKSPFDKKSERPVTRSRSSHPWKKNF
jgi:hypothetical protein